MPKRRRGERKGARSFNELEETCLRRELSLGAIVSSLVPMSVCPSFPLTPVVRLSAAMPVSMSVSLSLSLRPVESFSLSFSQIRSEIYLPW